MRLAPGFALAAIGSIAVGIGGNTPMTISRAISRSKSKAESQYHVSALPATAHGKGGQDSGGLLHWPIHYSAA
jgi:hypothetical protein